MSLSCLIGPARKHVHVKTILGFPAISFSSDRRNLRARVSCLRPPAIYERSPTHSLSTIFLTMDNKDQAEHSLISTSLEVEQLDLNLFRSKSLWVPARARGVFGGQVISQAIVSATNCVSPEYGLHVSPTRLLSSPVS